MTPRSSRSASITTSLYDLGSHIVVGARKGSIKLSGVEHLQFADGTITVADDGNALFDTYYYLSRNPDVFHAGVNALDHFNSFGRHEGRDPNAFRHRHEPARALSSVRLAGGPRSVGRFRHALYSDNPDVAALDVDPLAHFLPFGSSEGRLAINDGIWH